MSSSTFSRHIERAKTNGKLIVQPRMGYGQVDAGATRLIQDSALLARRSGCERLIVKTMMIAAPQSNTCWLAR